VAISVLDVRDTFAAPRVRIAAATPAASAARRLPVPLLAAGSIGVLQAIGLLAVALTGLDGVLASAVRPEGWMVVGGLFVLAGWIVLCAGSGAAIIDAAGRRLFTGVAYVELLLVAVLLVVATAVGVPNPTTLPLPALGLLALAVPVGKLLLVSAPSARRRLAEGPRVRACRPDPVRSHQVLATLTLAFIGLALGAVAVLSPVHDGGANDPASAVFTQD
jgi:hypothetical protein